MVGKFKTIQKHFTVSCNLKTIGVWVKVSMNLHAFMLHAFKSESYCMNENNQIKWEQTTWLYLMGHDI